MIPDPFRLERILAAQKWPGFAIDKFFQAESLRSASQPVTDYTVVRFDCGKQYRCDDLFL